MPVSKSQSHKKSWGDQVQHGVARKENLGNTNTPLDVARLIVKECVPESAFLGRLLEPCVGAGNFYLAVLERAQELGLDVLEVAKRFDAFDIDPDAIRVAKTRIAETFGWDASVVDTLPLSVKDFGDLASAPVYSLIITNPPYLSTRIWGKTEDERLSMQKKWHTLVPQADGRADLYIYFFHHAHQCLTPNGTSIFLCADGWLDAGYGKSLREEFVSSVALTTIKVWPWKALFRDDTCPIVTVAEKKVPSSTRLIIDERDPLTGKECYINGNHEFEQVLNLKDMKKWFAETSVNRRQRVLLPPVFYRALERAMDTLQDHGARLGSITTLTSFSWSMQDLERAGIVKDNPLLPKSASVVAEDADTADKLDADKNLNSNASSASSSTSTLLPVFFQKQARVGKPVDYRQFRTTASLAHELALGDDKLSQKVSKLGGRTGGVWISQAIDRFPLVFAQDPKDQAHTWYGVSKYLHAQTKQPEILCGVLSSTPALLSFEMTLKEGTRKTLRVNENGFAKEITKGDLEILLVPNSNKWSKATCQAVAKYQARKGLVSLSRMDEAVKNQDWQAIDRLVMSELGWNDAEQKAMQALALALYWRRMRNVLEYGHAHAEAMRLLKVAHWM